MTQPEDISAAADRLPLTPNPAAQHAAAARLVARQATDKDDLAALLDALGLPAGENDVAELLPLLTTPTEPDHGDTHTMTTDTTQAPNAFEAVALSMHADGAGPDAIHEATGITSDELTALLGADDGQDQDAPSPAGTDNAIEDLLAWAEQHPDRAVQDRAARVRADIARLTKDRATDEQAAEVEAKVERLRAELARAEQELQELRGGATVTGIASAKFAAGSSREELRVIRAWARANGYQVSDRGLIPKTVREAFIAAHTTETAKAS